MNRLTLCIIVTLFAATSLSACRSSTHDSVFAELPSYSNNTGPIQHVVHISVDGLRQDAVVKWVDQLPGYKRLRLQGAFTDNARTTPTMGNTLPNHTSQLTGRVVAGPNGHAWDTNRYPDTTVTLHSKKGAYVSSVFDVVHEAGLKGALFTSKPKFAVFRNSYRDKLDTYVYRSNTEKLTNRFVDSLNTDTYAYLFLHIRNPDTMGHRFGWRLWSWHPYAWAVRKSDRLINQILTAIDDSPALRGKTAVIVTADHGGHKRTHGPNHQLDYTIPFYVWGPGIPTADLYELAPATRQDPGMAQIADSASLQPIRNGDAANLALSMIGLSPVPGSTLGVNQPLLQRKTDTHD